MFKLNFEFYSEWKNTGPALGKFINISQVADQTPFPTLAILNDFNLVNDFKLNFPTIQTDGNW